MVYQPCMFLFSAQRKGVVMKVERSFTHENWKIEGYL
jgi:hypothetical protein